MADDPFGTHTYVFAFRIAVPWLVHVLPFSHDTSFTALAWLFSGAASAVLFVLLDRLRISRGVSVPLAIALAVSPPLLVASLRQGRSPDALTALVMVTGALFIVERRPVPLAITMVVGALNRESALFLAPLAYAVWAERVVDLRVLRTVALAAVPAVAAFVTLRLAIPTVGREDIPGYGGSLVGGRIDVIEEALESPAVQLRRVFSVFGPLWFVAPFALRDFAFARRGLVLVALCALACTWALDWGRIFFIAAPVVYAASGWVLDRRPAWRAPVLALMALLVVGYAAYMQIDGVENLIEAGPPPYPVR